MPTLQNLTGEGLKVEMRGRKEEVVQIGNRQRQLARSIQGKLSLQSPQTLLGLISEDEGREGADWAP